MEGEEEEEAAEEEEEEEEDFNKEPHENGYPVVTLEQ